MASEGGQSHRIELARQDARRLDLAGVYRLAYVSDASDLMEEGELQKIGERSMKRNADLDVTGILVMDAGRILQILEGGRESGVRSF